MDSNASSAYPGHYKLNKLDHIKRWSEDSENDVLSNLYQRKVNCSNADTQDEQKIESA